MNMDKPQSNEGAPPPRVKKSTKTAPPKPVTPPAAKAAPSEPSYSARTIEKQFGRSSGKREWLTWLIGFAVLGGFLVGGKLLYAFIDDQSRVTWVIAVLFGATLWKSWRDVSFLDRETRLASKQVKQLQEINDLNRFVAEANDSLFRSHIHSLYTIFRNDSQISQESLVEVLHARLVARNKSVDLFANVMITLGLIGTIIGLIDSVEPLQKVLGGSTSDVSSVTTEMERSLGGLSTAFNTTLLGAMFGGVVLRVLNGVVDANILNYVAHLAELTDVYVLPPMRKMARELGQAGLYTRQAQGTATS